MRSLPSCNFFAARLLRYNFRLFRPTTTPPTIIMLRAKYFLVDKPAKPRDLCAVEEFLKDKQFIWEELFEKGGTQVMPENLLVPTNAPTDCADALRVHTCDIFFPRLSPNNRFYVRNRCDSTEMAQLPSRKVEKQLPALEPKDWIVQAIQHLHDTRPPGLSREVLFSMRSSSP